MTPMAIASLHVPHVSDCAAKLRIGASKYQVHGDAFAQAVAAVCIVLGPVSLTR